MVWQAAPLMRGLSATYSPSWIRMVQRFTKTNRATYDSFCSGNRKGNVCYGTDCAKPSSRWKACEA